MKWYVLVGAVLAAVLLQAGADGNEKSVFDAAPENIQRASVMVECSDGTGSGVIFKNGASSFVWTDAHVITEPSISTMYDPKTKRPFVHIEFKDASVVQPIVEQGRKVGYTSHLAKVIRYSPKHDLALLLVYKSNYGESSVTFSAETPRPGIGIWHVGSMKGFQGISSVSFGTVAFAGRLRLGFEDNEANGIIYDQISCTFHHGSSGGGVFLKSGECIGLVTEFLDTDGIGALTYGTGCVTPSRRIIEFAREHKVGFAVSVKESVPPIATIVRSGIYVDPISLPKDFPK